MTAVIRIMQAFDGGRGNDNRQVRSDAASIITIVEKACTATGGALILMPQMAGQAVLTFARKEIRSPRATEFPRDNKRAFLQAEETS